MGKETNGDTTPADGAESSPPQTVGLPVDSSETVPLDHGVQVTVPQIREAGAEPQGVRYAAAAAPVPPKATRRSHMWDSPTLTEIHEPAVAPDYRMVTHPSRRLLRWWILGAVALVAIAGTAVVLLRYRSDESGPAQAVREYFADLASGDSAAAMTLVADASTYSAAANPLLTSSALDTPADRPSQATITGSAATTLDGGAAATSVSVTYSIDGTPVQQTIVVVAAGAGSADHPNLLKAPFITVSVTAAKDRAVKVNGVTYPAGASQTLAFPGAYAAAVPGNQLIAPSTARATYDSQSGAVKADIWLPAPQLASGGNAAVQAAVNKALDSCAASTAAAPPGCPFQYSDSGASLHWKITKYPQVRAKVSSIGAVTYADGGHAATVHYDANTDGFLGLFPRTHSGDMGVDVAGTATVSGGDVAVTFTK